MKVLLVNGSPHQEGCTHAALRVVADALEKSGVETTLHWLGAKPIPGCMDCGKCAVLKRCVLNDSVNDFRELAKDYDGFVFGTPVYYAGMNASLKAFMDRLFFSDLWGGRNTFAFKPAAAVVSARRCGMTAAYDQIHKYFGHSQMPIVTSVYWNMVFGMKPEEVEADREGMATMKILGRNMAYLLKCIDAGRQLSVTQPTTERE